MVDGQGKLILHERSGRAELYDLANDPAERRDLAAHEPAAAAPLRWALEDVSRDSIALEPVELGAEQQRMLEALGYVDTPPHPEER